MPMKTRVSGLLLLAAGLLAGAAHAQAAVDRAALVRLGASVMKIEVLQSPRGYGLGSGVVVAADKVVTNCHVTRNAQEIHVLRGEVRWRVDAQAIDLEHDLCVLRAPGMKGSPVELGQAGQLKVGQTVTALGYTGGIGIQLSPGEVVALYKLDGSRVVQTTNWFSSGASGGGLFDADQRLVGILTFRLRGGATHYFSGPVEWLQPLLSSADAFVPVAMLDSASRAYWERPLEQQPDFLQAAVFEQQKRWPELEALASAWASSDTTDPHPWNLLALALAALDRLPESRRATQRATELQRATESP